ncbi:MAG: DEAD/DEAH box helicase [Bacteroidales bacterium]|nr:DEAD/DEAH box helicase [Bacteroidales bacterium]
MKSFEELGLSGQLLAAIRELGFEHPMPIQEEVIPYLLEGDNDVVALAQTGTGKTAAFGLPLLQKLDLDTKDTQALVLCPTRELCIQIADDLKDYAKYLDNLYVLPVYGGASIKNQIMGLKKGVQVIVATPGRLIDLMERGHVDLSKVRNVVMDEADEMLNMGFTEDINTILAAVPENRNTLLFSATMPAEIEKISRTYMRDPREIVIGRKNESTASVRHICYMVKSTEKYQTLKRIIDYYPRIYGIIFCRTKVETQEIADKLIHDGYNVDSLHGDLSQVQRDYVMQRFRIHNIQLLVATDVAARGLDVDDLTHVINYTLPDETEVYTHRSGRTGRAGKTGISIAILNMREAHKVRTIEKLINKTFEVGKIPTGKEICSKQIFNLMDRIEKVEVNEEEISDILPSVFSKLEWLDKEELVKRMVALEFNRIIAYYRDNEDFTAESDTLQTKRERNHVEVKREEGFTKLFINIGKMDGFGPKDFLGMINNTVGKTGDGKISVGRIDLFTRYSLFDVDQAHAEEVMRELGSLRLRGRSIRVSEATDEQIDRGIKEKSEPRKKHRKKNN